MIRSHRRYPFGLLLALLASSVLAHGCSSKSQPTEPETPSISVAISPASASIAQGGTTTATATLTGSGGFTGTATITVENAPSGVTGTVSDVSSSGGNTTATVTITVAASAVPGSYNLTIRATGSGVSAATAGFALTVTDAPAFELSATPSQLIIEREGDASTAIGISRTNFTGDVTLAAEGAPTGVTAAFDSNPASGNLSNLTLSADASAALGASTITVTGSAPGLADRTTTVEILITEPAASDYLLGVLPATLTINQGATEDAEVTLTRSNFGDPVTLTAENVPPGVTVTFDPSPSTGTTVAVTVDVGASVAAGDYTMTIRGTAAGLPDKTVTLDLTVEETPAYSIALTPVTTTIAQGASGTVDVEILRTTSFTESVTLALEDAPAGVTGSFSVNPIAGAASVLTLDVGGTTVPGDYVLTVRGTSTLPDETAVVTLTVPEPVGFSLASIAGVTIQQGASGVRAVTIERTGGFSGDVTVTVTDLPAGITASVDPVTTAGTSVDVTVDVAGSVAAGSYSATVRGNSSGLPESTQTLGITVTAATGQQVVLDFSPCVTDDRPVWLAYQDGSGPWTPVTGANDVYTFSVAESSFAVALATEPAPGQSNVFVQFATPAEIVLLDDEDLCDTSPVGKTVNATVAGIDNAEGEMATLTLGDASIFSLFADGPFQFTGVPDGLVDLIGYKAHPASTTDRMIILRDLNPASGGNLGVLDFGGADGFDPSTATMTPQGGGAPGAWYSEYATSPSAGVCYYAPLQSGLIDGNPFTIRGAPVAEQQASEFHVVTLVSGLNTVSETFATLANRSISFGAPLPAPTVTDLAGSYRRIRVELTLPAEYDDVATVFLSDQAGDRSITTLASPGWLAGLAVSIEIPDLSGVAGWDGAWGPTNAATSDWAFGAAGWTGDDCTEGAREVTTIEVGTIG